MKKLEELGISPTPWSIVDFCTSHYGVASSCGYRTSDTRLLEDARIIAAAPDLYEACLWCLRQANEIGSASIGGSVNTSALAMSMAGIVRRCEKVLARAAGEEVENV